MTKAYNPKVFDVRCERCDNVFETKKEFREPSPECPKCGSNFTHTILTGFKPALKAKDPYDLLDGYVPDTKPIRSFANDRRRKGKNTV